MTTAHSATARVTIAGLQVAKPLFDLLQDEVAPGTGIAPEHFWTTLAQILAELTPRNRELLARRDDLQAKIDDWHRQRRGQAHDHNAYVTFLENIGYLAADDTPCTIKPQNVDPEIARIAGPQLVVPVNNARYALNAANARWGSLFDALYGTDALGFDLSLIHI